MTMLQYCWNRCGRREIATFKQVVNDALREGLARLSSPAETQAFRTQPVDLGSCYYPNLDNVWEVLDEVERSGTGR
jgi:hypothetical protein